MAGDGRRSDPLLGPPPSRRGTGEATPAPVMDSPAPGIIHAAISEQITKRNDIVMITLL